MERFKLPKISSIIERFVKRIIKAKGHPLKFDKRKLYVGILLAAILATNGAFWAYRASKNSVIPKEADPKLKQWEIDLSENYLDAEKSYLPWDVEIGDDDLVDTSTEISEVDKDSLSDDLPASDEDIPVDTFCEVAPADTAQEFVDSIDVTRSMATMALPTLGKVITEHSVDRLVYSKTLNQWGVHPGVDIAAELGSAVKAAMEGTVMEVRKDDPKLGVVIVLDHGNEIKTLYGNLASDKVVKRGDAVSQGQVIGSVGQSAPYEIEDPPHLHFEIFQGDDSVDPSEYIPKVN